MFLCARIAEHQIRLRDKSVFVFYVVCTLSTFLVLIEGVFCRLVSTRMWFSGRLRFRTRVLLYKEVAGIYNV